MSRTDSARPAQSDSTAPGALPLRRRILGAIAALALGLGLAGAVSAPAHSAGTGVVSGTVTTTGDAPLGSALVTLIECVAGAQDCYTTVGSVVTDVDGTFEFTDLTAGEYIVHVKSQADPYWATEFWDGAHFSRDATRIAVADDAVTTVNPTLEAGGAIGGTITGAAAAPLENVLVQLYYCNPDPAPYLPDCWDLVPGLGGNAYTASDGTFTYGGLVPGDYKAVIHPQSANANYIFEYWDGSDSLDSAAVITVAANATSTINPTLEIGATVSGTVVDGAGNPVESGYVYAFLSTYDQGSRGGATVQPDGSYIIQGLPAGDYILEAGPAFNTGSTLIREYWNNHFDRADADSVTLTQGQSFTADFELLSGGIVEGTVTDASSTPVADVDVEVFRQEANDYWSRAKTTTTDSSGEYRIEGLGVGNYVVKFSDFDGDLAHQYWNGSADRAGATVLEIAPGDLVDNIDATLAPGGTVSGTITQNDGTGAVPADGAYVTVWMLNSDDAWEVAASDETDASGDYEVSGLAPGTYTVQSEGVSADWSRPYFGGGFYEDEADDFAVAASTTVPDIDIEVPLGTLISGNFYDAEGGPATGVWTSFLHERSPGVWVTPPPSGGAGDDVTYQVGGLPPGNYIVYWEDHSDSATPYTTQYWQNAPTQGTATIIDATEGGEFTGISAELTRDPWPAPTASATATPAAPNGANGWYTSNVSVELSSGGGTAVPDTLQYKIGSGSWTDYSSAISVTTNGATVITYRAVEEDLQTSPEGTLEIKLDKTAPTVGSSISGRTVTVTSSDATSGVALVEYKLGSAEWATYSAPVAVGNAAVTIQFRATDAAGNVSAAGSRDVPAAVGDVTVDATLDPAAPNGDNGWYVSDVTLTGSGSAEIGGPVTVEYKIGSGSYTELTGPLTLSDEGTTTVTLRAIDANDNESDEITRIVKIDSVKPTVSLSTAGSTEAERVVTATAADGSGSGVASIEYSIDAGGWQAYSAPIELSLAAQTVNLRSIDEAGNVSAVATQSFPAVSGTVTVDATQSPAAPNGSDGWYTTSPVTVTGSGTSSLDGDVTVLSKVGAGVHSENAVRTVTAQGTTVITFMAEDEYGFESGEITRTVKLDTVVPTVGSNASGRTVTITSSDATSGVASTQYRIDGGSWTAYTAPVAVPGAGAATVEFRATDAAGNVSSIGSRSIAAVPQEPERIAGSDRFETATLSSEASYPDGADVVYITTGLLFPDALSAGPAAALEGGPLLLVPPTFVPDSVLEEIERLDPDRIVVIGGTPSVSSAVFSELKSLVSNTVRIAGVDRFDTSRKVTAAAFGDVGADIAYIATGLNFPDALAAGGAAGINEAPVILVNGGATSLDSATRTLLQDLGVTEVKVLGGPTSVSTGVENSLKSLLGSSNVDRIAGSDRFETARLVNLDAFGAADTVFLATGLNFPDALAGSAWAAKENAPLYVVLPTCIPPLVLDAIESHDASEIILLGGTPSLGTAVRDLTPCS